MPSNLIDSVKSFITPDLISKASSYLGENTDNVSKAITGAVPAVISGIIGRVESGDVSGVLNNAKDALNNNVLGNASALLSGGAASTGSTLVNNLFGSQTNNVVNALASHSGIKTSSAGSILSMIVPLILGVLGKHATDNNLSSGGLSAFLSEQKSGILSMLPPGLNISNLPGSAKKVIGTTAADVRSIAEQPKRNWLMPLVLIALAIILIIYFMRSCNKTPEANTAATADTTTMAAPAMAPDTTATMAPARESLKVKLADGTEIEAYKGGIEDMLVTCLNDANCKPGKDKWFDFDNLNFETGSATITTESQVQVSNIVAILKAYPKAKVKIGGYTDKTGNETDNKKLSQARADAVLNAIKTAGANATQLVGAEGYGSQFATMPATASDEDRKKDRRISVQLREK